MVSFSKRDTVGAKQLTERKKHITKQALKKHITQEEVELKEGSHRPLEVTITKESSLAFH